MVSARHPQTDDSTAVARVREVLESLDGASLSDGRLAADARDFALRRSRADIQQVRQRLRNFNSVFAALGTVAESEHMARAVKRLSDTHCGLEGVADERAVEPFATKKSPMDVGESR